MSAPVLDILIPTYDRAAALAVTLTSLCAQTETRFAVTIADQSDQPVAEVGEVRAAVLVLEAHGCPVTFHRNLPRRGLGQQRDFLLGLAQGRYCLFLDDDLILEPWVVAQLLRAIERAGCGFVGSAVIGLSYRDDVRPDQQAHDFWEGTVEPELVERDTPAWERYCLHNAANLWHVQRAHGLTPETSRLYKVAWTGGCVLYDTAMLRDVGGFGFWVDLPREHAGEDVLAQLRVMARHGGAGVMPSGVYHQELPTTIVDRSHDAPKLFSVL